MLTKLIIDCHTSIRTNSKYKLILNSDENTFSSQFPSNVVHVYQITLLFIKRIANAYYILMLADCDCIAEFQRNNFGTYVTIC